MRQHAKQGTCTYPTCTYPSMHLPQHHLLQPHCIPSPSVPTMSITYISPLTKSREHSTTATASRGGEPVVPSTTDSWSSRAYTLVSMSIRLQPAGEQAGKLFSMQSSGMHQSREVTSEVVSIHAGAHSSA